MRSCLAPDAKRYHLCGFRPLPGAPRTGPRRIGLGETKERTGGTVQLSMGGWEGEIALADLHPCGW